MGKIMREDNSEPAAEKQTRPDTALPEPKVIWKVPAGTAPAQPVVSVITVVLNAVRDGGKDELKQCLGSVQDQTGVPIEHLIIDGASSDGTAELIGEYDNANVPIRLLSEPDEGIYDAMNKGLRLARGKYVTFLNSDDFYSNPNGLADSVRWLEESGADFSYAPISVLDGRTGRMVEHSNCIPDVNFIFVQMPFSHQSMVIRRESMMEIGGFDLRYRSAADYDSVLRLIFTRHRACFVPTKFVSFRLGGFSCVNEERSLQEVGTIYSRLFGKYLSFDVTPDEGREINVTKQCPKELKRKEFSFARSAFGDAISFEHDPSDDLFPDKKFMLLKERLRAISLDRSFFSVVGNTAKLLFFSPVLFCDFLLTYFRCRGKCEGNEAGKMACGELLSRLQAKRKAKSLNDKTNADPCGGQERACLKVSARDYWRTNGVYTVEPWGAWTGGKFSALVDLPENFRNRPLAVEISIGGYVFPGDAVRTVDVFVNGQKIDGMKLRNYMPMPHSFRIPASAASSTVLDFDFVVDRTFVPKEIGHGEDTRTLGMSFQEFSVKRTDD